MKISSSPILAVNEMTNKHTKSQNLYLFFRQLVVRINVNLFENILRRRGLVDSHQLNIKKQCST